MIGRQLRRLLALCSVAVLAGMTICTSAHAATTITPFRGGDELLACAPNSDFCITASRFATRRDTGLRVYASRGARVTHAGLVRNFSPVGDACASPRLCVIVGVNTPIGSEATYVVVRNGIPSAARAIRKVADVTAVACATDTRCVAVGNPYGSGHGLVVPIVNGVAQAAEPMQVPGALVVDPMNVACWGASYCFSTGVVSPDGYVPSNGIVVPIVNGIPGPVQVTPQNQFFTSRLACAPGTSACWALGLDGTTPDSVPITGGVLGAAIDEPTLGSPGAFACQTATACFATTSSGSHGVVLPVTSGVPGTAMTLPISDLHGLACPSAAGCLAVGRGKLAAFGAPAT